MKSRGSIATSITGAIACGLLACADATPPAGVAALQAAIVNGTRSPMVVPMTPEQQLAIGWLAGASSPETAFCTGTLLTARHVVTAAHCIVERTPASTVFGLGADPARPAGVATVAQIYTHPQLDVALLELAAEAQATVPTVVPIAGNAEDLSGDFGRSLLATPVEAAGFGETLDPERTGLWFVALPLVDITAEFVVVDGGGERGLCRGDSGGPVLAVSRLGAPLILGVEHGGSDDCVGRDRLTRLDVAAPWIRQVLSGVIRPDGAPAGCGDLDFNGICDDDTVRWCNEDAVPAARDCRLEGATCGWAGEALGFYCITLDTTCADLGGGVCLDGRVRRFCLADRVTEDDCFKAGLRCAQDDAGAQCVDEQGTPVAPRRKFNSGCAAGDGGAPRPPSGSSWWPQSLILRRNRRTTR